MAIVINVGYYSNVLVRYHQRNMFDLSVPAVRFGENTITDGC